MLRTEAVAACVAKMNQQGGMFAAHDDETKKRAAEYAFERLHADAEKYLPFGAPESELAKYGKAALKRVHREAAAMSAAKFEQVNGFPLLLVLGLLPTLWSWWKMLKEWMGW